jgi:tetratricopeptide (TPR) repeat protein
MNKPPEELATEIEGRLAVAASGGPWEVWLETGVIALAAGKPEIASRCFAECLKDGAIPANPYAHLLMGRSLLLQGQLPEAQLAYSEAISAASRDIHTGFHVRFLYMDDLYKAGKYQLALCGEGPLCQSLVSPYPLEQAFGIYETLMSAWSIGDSKEITRLTVELEKVLPETRARPESPFEIRRIKEAQNFLRRIKQAQAGDDYVAMILDEEAGWFDRCVGNHLSIRNRLLKWVTKHRISEYTELEDEEQKFALLSTHYFYNFSASLAGLHLEAEYGLRELIENIPLNKETAEKVSNCHIGLGYCLHQQRRFHEAMDVFENAFNVISPDSPWYGSLLAHINQTSGALQATEESSR